MVESMAPASLDILLSATTAVHCDKDFRSEKVLKIHKSKAHKGFEEDGIHDGSIPSHPFTTHMPHEQQLKTFYTTAGRDKYEQRVHSGRWLSSAQSLITSHPWFSICHHHAPAQLANSWSVTGLLFNWVKRAQLGGLLTDSFSSQREEWWEAAP